MEEAASTAKTTSLEDAVVYGKKQGHGRINELKHHNQNLIIFFSFW